MPRRKPTVKLDVIGNRGLNPEKAVGNFRESKIQQNYFVKQPKWDSAGDGVELLAIENDREHTEMLQLQAELLEHGKRQSAINASRTNQLFKMHTRLRERFIKTTNFIKNLDDKKKFAEQKVSEEKRTHADLKHNIQSCKSKIEMLTEFRKVLKGTVKEFEPYEMIVNDVVAQQDIFSSIKDCTDRCDALMMAQDEIVELNHMKLQEIEELRLRMVKLNNDAASTVLGLNNELAKLEREYAQAHSESLKWEKMLVNTKDCIARTKNTRYRMMDEIQIMFRVLNKRKEGVFVMKRLDIEEAMDFIRDEILIMQAVAKECIKS